MAERTELADALARAAREINSPGDLTSTLDGIVQTAQRSLPGVDHVGISIAHRDGKIETKVGTDPLDLERMEKKVDAISERLGLYPNESDEPTPEQEQSPAAP